MMMIVFSVGDALSFWAGLYGNEGVLPARWMLRVVGKSMWERLRDTPSLLWFGPRLGLDTQHCMEFLSLSGTLLSLAAMTIPAFRDCRLYLILWVLYLSLYQVRPSPQSSVSSDHIYITLLHSGCWLARRWWLMSSGSYWCGEILCEEK